MPEAISPLGRQVAYIDRYDPTLLYPIERAPKRAELGLADAPLPFHGADLWSAYEVSWLDLRGKPQVAIAHVSVPCTTPRLVESKSFKLYLNSFNAQRVPDAETLARHLVDDLHACVGAGIGGERVQVSLVRPAAFGDERLAPLRGVCLDDLELDGPWCPPDSGAAPGVRPEWLRTRPEAPVDEHLHTHLFKSNCPVTGQPHWASVEIGWRGPPLDRAGLLAYLVSYRQQGEFHEHCVERIFMDLWTRGRPQRLEVLARYTRRGGLDINPWRCSDAAPSPGFARSVRQ